MIGYEYINAEDSVIEKGGYYLTINNKAVMTESIIKELNITYEQYKEVTLSCNAAAVQGFFKFLDFVFPTKEDAECAITTLKLFTK